MDVVQMWAGLEPDDWEVRYQRLPRLPSDAELVALLRAHPEVGAWLGVRARMGPPGESFPGGEEGARRLWRSVVCGVRLGQRVKRLEAELPSIHDVTPEDLMAAVAQVEPLEWLVPWSVAGLAGPLGKLLGGLIMLRGLPDDHPGRGHVATLVADAILALGAYQLMPLRLGLLSEAVKFASTPRDAVEATMSLANTIGVVYPHDDEAMRGSVAMYEVAQAGARELGDSELFADITAMYVGRAAVVLLDDPDTFESTRARLLAALDEVAPHAVEAATRAKLLHARATVVGHSGPHGSRGDHVEAAKLLEEALKLDRRNDHWRYSMMVELGVHHVQAGRYAAAQEVLEQCLSEGAAIMVPADRARALGTLARVHEAQGRPERAAELAREASRQAVSVDERAQLQLHQATDLLNAGQLEAAGSIARRLVADVDQVTTSLRFDVWRLAMICALHLGHREQAEEARNAAVAEAGVSGRSTHIELLWRTVGAPLAQALEAVVAYVQGDLGPPSPDAEPMVAELIARGGGALPEAVRRVLAKWAVERRSPVMSVELLVELEQHDLARAVLEHASVDEPVDRVLLGVMKVQLHAQAPLPTRRAWVRDLIDLVPSLPSPSFLAGHNVALACELVADGDPDWLERPLDIWPRVFGWARSPEHRERAAKRWLQDLAVWAQSLGNRSTSAFADRLAAFVVAAPHLRTATPHNVRSFLGNAMLFGALTHPGVVAALEQLLHQLPATLVTPDVAGRLHAIQPAQTDPGVAVLGLDPAFGEVALLPPIPKWLVEVALGHPVGELPRDLLESVQPWIAVCHARPDCSDVVLARLVSALPHASARQREPLVALVLENIQRGVPGPNTWKNVAAAVEALPGTFDRRSELVGMLQRGGLLRHVKVDSTRNASLNDRFQQACVRMRQARTAVSPTEAQAHKEVSIEILTGVLDEAPPEARLAYRVSLANALRLPPKPDYIAAIAIYEEVVATTPSAEQRGQVHKVWADALIERADDGDFAAARMHVQQALQLRTGRWKGETHLSAATLASKDPALDDAERARTVGLHFIEAARLAPDATRAGLHHILAAVREWADKAPGSFDADRVRAVLTTAWPERTDDIAAATGGLNRAVAVPGSDDLYPAIVSFLEHPAGQAYTRLTEGLADPHERERQERMLRELAERVGADAPTIPDHFNDVETIRARLETVHTGPEDEAVGRRVAGVVLCARLVRLGHRDAAEARTRSTDAEALLDSSDLPPTIQAHFLEILSEVWAPDNDRSDPVRDFARAARLTRKAMACTDSAPTRSQRIRLARSLRYSEEGRRVDNWKEARRLFEAVLESDRASKNAGHIANTLHMLAELVSHTDGGDQTARLREAIGMLREAVALATTDGMKGRYLGNLAWDLSRLSESTPDASEAQRIAHEAEACFVQALELVSDPDLAANIQTNADTHRSMVCRRSGDHAGAIAVQRQRLAREQQQGTPHRVATAQHNLANVLWKVGDRAGWSEAVTLVRQALVHRRAIGEPRNIWESTTVLGELLLEWKGERSLAVRAEVAELLREAAAAARTLGSGTELHRSGLGMAQLALLSQATDLLLSRAEAAWQWLGEALPSLLTDSGKRHQAADIARLFLVRVARVTLSSGPIGLHHGAQVVRGARTEAILTWWRRAESAWRRLSRARLEHPQGVPMSTILDWRKALAQGNPAPLARLLRTIHTTAPGWLTEPPSLEPTRAWLRARGAVALSAWPLADGLMVAVVGPSVRQNTMAWLPGVRLADSEADVAAGVRQREQRDAVLGRLSAWAERVLAPVVQGLVDRPPKTILWVPHGVLRLVPHRALFGSTPVWRAPSLALAPDRPHRMRPDTTTIVIAEPRSQPIGSVVIDQAAALATNADRLLVARGDRFGPAAHPRAEARPVDANTVMDACDQAAVVVVLAHGHATTEDDAWLHLLRPDGTEDRLDLPRLSTDPRALAGLRIVLLACESGRTGGRPHQPGGIAGTLLMAGAKAVVAPMWPVKATTAVRVGRALLEGLAHQRAWPSVLAKLGRNGLVAPDSAELGGPPSKAARAAGKWDVAAFVCFVS